MKMGLDNPLLGVGMGNYTDKYQKEYIDQEAKESYIAHAHNNFFSSLLKQVCWGGRIV